MTKVTKKTAPRYSARGHLAHQISPPRELAEKSWQPGRQCPTVEAVSARSPGRDDEPLALQEAQARMRHIRVGSLQFRDYVSDRNEHRSVVMACRLRLIRVCNAHVFYPSKPKPVVQITTIPQSGHQRSSAPLTNINLHYRFMYVSSGHAA